MHNDKSLWAGLNKPDLDMAEADVAVFGIPFDGSVSFRAGASEAPDALRNITRTITPTTEFFESFEELKVKDIGNFEKGSRDEIFKAVENATEKLVREGTFFTMIGGDHSVTIPVLRGIDKALDEPFGIIHLDAHFDICDELGGDKLSHGCTERRALELENITGPENFFFIGVRSIEMDELHFIKGKDFSIISAHDFNKLGVSAVVDKVKQGMRHFNKIYLTVDIDCLDPAFAAGTGTPQFGGMNSRELLDLLIGLFDLPIIGFDVVEVAPSLDPSLTSVFAARKIVTECWGHQWRKNKLGAL